MATEVSYSNGLDPDLPQQYLPPPLLPKPGKDNARLQKLKKRRVKRRGSLSQTPVPFRSCLSPVDEASTELEPSDQPAPPKSPDSVYISDPSVSSFPLGCFRASAFPAPDVGHVGSPPPPPSTAGTSEEHVAPLFECSSAVFDEATPFSMPPSDSPPKQFEELHLPCAVALNATPGARRPVATVPIIETSRSSTKISTHSVTLSPATPMCGPGSPPSHVTQLPPVPLLLSVSNSQTQAFGQSQGATNHGPRDGPQVQARPLASTPAGNDSASQLTASKAASVEATREMKPATAQTRIYTSKATFYEIAKPPSFQDLSVTSYPEASSSKISRENLPVSGTKGDRSQVAASWSEGTRAKTSSCTPARGPTPFFEISRANPLLFAASPALEPSQGLQTSAGVIEAPRCTENPDNRPNSRPAVADLKPTAADLSSLGKASGESQETDSRNAKKTEVSQKLSPEPAVNVPNPVVPNPLTFPAYQTSALPKVPTFCIAASNSNPKPAICTQTPSSPKPLPVIYRPVAEARKSLTSLLETQMSLATPKPKPRPAYYGLTPTEYVAYGGIRATASHPSPTAAADTSQSHVAVGAARGSQFVVEQLNGLDLPSVVKASGAHRVHGLLTDSRGRQGMFGESFSEGPRVGLQTLQCEGDTIKPELPLGALHEARQQSASSASAPRPSCSAVSPGSTRGKGPSGRCSPAANGSLTSNAAPSVEGIDQEKNLRPVQSPTDGEPAVSSELKPATPAGSDSQSAVSHQRDTGGQTQNSSAKLEHPETFPPASPSNRCCLDKNEPKFSNASQKASVAVNSGPSLPHEPVRASVSSTHSGLRSEPAGQHANHPQQVSADVSNQAADSKPQPKPELSHPSQTTGPAAATTRSQPVSVEAKETANATEHQRGNQADTSRAKESNAPSTGATGVLPGNRTATEQWLTASTSATGVLKPAAAAVTQKTVENNSLETSRASAHPIEHTSLVPAVSSSSRLRCVTPQSPQTRSSRPEGHFKDTETVTPRSPANVSAKVSTTREKLNIWNNGIGPKMLQTFAQTVVIAEKLAEIQTSSVNTQTSSCVQVQNDHDNTAKSPSQLSASSIRERSLNPEIKANPTASTVVSQTQRRQSNLSPTSCSQEKSADANTETATSGRDRLLSCDTRVKVQPRFVENGPSNRPRGSRRAGEVALTPSVSAAEPDTLMKASTVQASVIDFAPPASLPQASGPVKDPPPNSGTSPSSQPRAGLKDTAALRTKTPPAPPTQTPEVKPCTKSATSTASSAEEKAVGAEASPAPAEPRAPPKVKGVKGKISGWTRLKKHMVVEQEEPRFPEVEHKPQDDSSSQEAGDRRKAPAGALPSQEAALKTDGAKALQMWDALLFQMFSTKDRIMQQIKATKKDPEGKQASNESQAELPGFVSRLPVLLYSPRFDARKLKEAAAKPLSKIAAVFEKSLLKRRSQEDECKDFNLKARGFASTVTTEA